jgi:hypothetical protein
MMLDSGGGMLDFGGEIVYNGVKSYQDVTAPRGVFFKRTLAPVPSKPNSSFALSAVFEARVPWQVLVGLRGTHSKAAFGV